MGHECDREHLFISYAGEDEVLAEWLTLKLTADGYRVWCDRFKLLGGESYPRDIDDAIKNRTFRLIALLSHASLQKPNPLKERTMALNIARERRIDFLIPLNVDGLQPTELDWMTSDLTFIPFYEGWAKGLKQLLEKLESIGAPRPVNDGKQIAAETFLPKNVFNQTPEVLYANCLSLLRIPKMIRRFQFSRSFDRSERDNLSTSWPFYSFSPTKFLSFINPPDPIPQELSLQENHGTNWQSVSEIEGIKVTNIISNLVSKALKVKCLEKGLKYSPDHKMLYFPKGLIDKDKISFESYTGKKTFVKVAGERSLRGVKYLYHLSPSFSIRQNTQNGFIVYLKIRLYISDVNGNPLQNKSVNSRRKKICKSWWNHQWLSRQLAICSFLSDGNGLITIGMSSNEQIVVSAKLHKYEAPFGIIESSQDLETSELENVGADLVETEFQDEYIEDGEEEINA